MSSPTPLTDAAECEQFPSTEPVVAAKRMRQLERELIAANEHINQLKGYLEASRHSDRLHADGWVAADLELARLKKIVEEERTRF